MKAFIFVRPRVLDLVEVDIPEIAEDGILCKVHTVGICGTDLRTWEGYWSSPLNTRWCSPTRS